jgi:hypothetical protein
LSHQLRSRTSLDWQPIFDLLWQSWACVRRVEVHFREDYVQWHKFRDIDHSAGIDYLTDTCKLIWKEEIDSFWRGLKTFTMAEEIDFVDFVPEYFAYRHARELGWQMDGTVLGDSRDSQHPGTEFRGKLINRRFPGQFDWILGQVHPRPQEAMDTSALVYDSDKENCKDFALEDPRAEDTAANSVATSTKTHFFNLPVEIRQLIYEYASEWRDRAYWPDRPKRWNTGVDFLYTSKQIAREALPSVYREFRLHGCSALEDLGELGQHISHVRRLELHFTCFGPCSQDMARDQRLSFTGTIYSQAVQRYTHPRHTMENERPSQDFLQRYMDMWSQAMVGIQAQPRIQEMEVTFASCCRYKARTHGGRTEEEASRQQLRCLALETHFLDLLAECQQVERVTLVGDVPPSLAVRLPLTIKSISSQMSGFMRATEEDRAAWDNAALLFTQWENTTPFPWMPYPTPHPVTHFVLVNEHSPRARWYRNVESNGEEEWEKDGMLPVTDGLTARSWEDIRDVADYNNEGDGLLRDL